MITEQYSMAPIYATAIIFVAFAIGEIVSNKTKALLSSMLVGMVLLMVGFWVGIPKDLFQASHLLPTAAICISLSLVSMGTMIKLRELVEQWKTFAIGFVAVILIVLLICGVGPLIIDRAYAFTGAPIVAGGIVAQIVMQGKLTEVGNQQAIVFGLLVLITQSLVGMPVTSFILKKEAKRFLDAGEHKEFMEKKAAEASVEKKKLIPAMPKEYQKPVVLLAKTAIIAALAIWAGTALTASFKSMGGVFTVISGFFNPNLVCMILGVVFCAIGFLEEDILNKANSFGLIMILVIVYCCTSLSSATPDMIISMLFPLLVCLGLGVAAICAGGFVMGKLLKVKPMMAIAIGMTALYGFPGTYNVTTEVAESMGKNEEEVAALKAYMLPQMLAAGFATVTIASVLVVGVVANLL